MDVCRQAVVIKLIVGGMVREAAEKRRAIGLDSCELARLL